MPRISSLEWLSPVAGVVTSARTDAPVIALTFDDGPDEQVTPAILDVLAARGARATFFVLAQRAERHRAIVERMLAEGHEVGLHGDVHQRLNRVGVRQAWGIVAGGRRRLTGVTGRRVRLFRPPGGAQTPASYLLARSLGLRIVMWSVALRDWVDRPMDEILGDARAAMAPGAIVLLHDGLATDRAVGFDRAELVDALLSEVFDRGWRTVPVGELLAGHPARREVWFKRRIRNGAIAPDSAVP